MKVRLVEAIIFRIALYGSESWTMKKKETSKIEAFEQWCWRRMLRIIAAYIVDSVLN